MQTLKATEFEKEYDLEIEIKKAIKGEFKPVTVTVVEDMQHETVILRLGEQDMVALTLNGALDLAREIRKAANRIGERKFRKKAEKRKK